MKRRTLVSAICEAFDTRIDEAKGYKGHPIVPATLSGKVLGKVLGYADTIIDAKTGKKIKALSKDDLFKRQLRKDKTYILWDYGMNQWIGDMKYAGKKGKKHVFQGADYPQDDFEVTFSDDELIKEFKAKKVHLQF